MFATLLGGLPRPPLPAGAATGAILEAIVAAQVDRGLEPLTDGGWASDPDDPVASWRSVVASAGATVVKAVVVGPYTGGVVHAGAIEAWRSSIERLADAGCPYVEVHEPAAAAIGADVAEQSQFRDLHDRLLDGLHEMPGLHLSLAVTGGSADTAGTETILTPPYASLAVDLIAGPDNWRLVRALPRERGVVCGALSPVAGSDDGPETLVWAAGYAASSAGRGLDRVGLATASSLAALDWATALGKLDRLMDAARIAVLPGDQLAAALDPRAVDARSAALGRYEPRPPRASGRPRPGRD